VHSPEDVELTDPPGVYFGLKCLKVHQEFILSGADIAKLDGLTRIEL